MERRTATIEETEERRALQVYLATRSIDEAQLVALRSALRVLPTIVSSPSIRPDWQRRLTLACFRALFISWASRNYPAHEIVGAAAAAYAAAYAAAAETYTVHPDLVAAAYASRAAAYASRASYATDSAAAAAYAAAASAADVAAFAAASDDAAAARAAIWAVVRADLEQAAESGAGSLLQTSLWAGVQRQVWVVNAENGFRNNVNKLGADWGVVRDWYAAVAKGHVLFTHLAGRREDVIVSLATEENKFWERDPDEVMRDVAARLRQGQQTFPEMIVSFLHKIGRPADIDEIRAYLGRSDTPPADTTIRGRLSDLAAKGEILRVDKGIYVHPVWSEKTGATAIADAPQPDALAREAELAAEQLAQSSAAYRFSVETDGPIDAIPMPGVAFEPDFAQTTLIEAIEKSEEFGRRLEVANAPPRVKRSVERALAALPQTVAQINPALLRSRTRSLEADAIAYTSAGAEAELFPDAVSELLDLVGTLKDLQGCFSEIAAVEKASAEVEIAGREDVAEKVLSEIGDAARDLSAQFPTVVTRAASDAVNVFSDEIAEAPTLEVKRHHLAAASLVARNFVAAAYRKVLSPTGQEALRVIRLHYGAVVDGSIDGTKELAKRAPVALLALYLGGPLAAAAVFLPDFRPLDNARKLVDRLSGKSSV